jgi:hypothetical protein
MTTPQHSVLEGQTEDTELPVLDFSPKQVTQIELFFDGQRVVCQRTPEGWKRSSDEESIRTDMVDDFLMNLAKLIRIGEVVGGADKLSEYGLASPSAWVKLQMNGRGDRTLTLGKRNPVQTSLYAQVDNTPQVILVGAVVLWDMRKLLNAAANAG